MASWIVHLRVADAFLDKLNNISTDEFVVGNIAPDSGVPDGNGSFVPDPSLSHFRKRNADGYNVVIVSDYINKYFTRELIEHYSKKEYSFFLGYLVHLMTDYLWLTKVYVPSVEKHWDEYTADKSAFIWGKLKKDYFDLDYLFLEKNRRFRAYEIYKSAVGFENNYIDIFSKEAMDNKRQSIMGFYSIPKDDLYREYEYITEKEVNIFVEECIAGISQWLRDYID